MNINWNKLQDGFAALTTYTLINDDTKNISIFVFDNELESPVLVKHLEYTDLKLLFHQSSYDLALCLDYTAFVELAKWMANYIALYSEVHPSILLRNWTTAFSNLNLVHLDSEEIQTVNLNLNTYVMLAEMWNPCDSWYCSNSEEFFDGILNLNNIYQELNGNTENPTILAKIASLQIEAAKAGFFENHPNFDITKTLNS